MSADRLLGRDIYWLQGQREAMERLADADVATLRLAYEGLAALLATHDYASNEGRRAQGALAAVIALTEQRRSA